MATTAEKLRQLRLAHGYTQVEIGEKTGVLGSSVSCWERGLSEPNIKQINILARLYNCKLSDIAGDNTDLPVIDRSEWEKDSEFMEHLDMVFRLPKDRQREIYRYIAYIDGIEKLQKKSDSTA